MEKTIAVLGGDRRMALLARLLAEDGHPVRTWGLAAFGMEDTALEEAAQADRVVLPVPLSRGKNLNCTAAALPLCGLFALLRPEQRLYAGGVKTADREAAAEFGLTLTDYLSREELAVRNGVPTAEGAIEAAMAATDVTLCGTPCLVIGFGRIGQAEGRIAKALGMNVIAYDLYPNESGRAIADYVTQDELFAKADVISLHCNLTPENAGLINRENIAKMKDGVILLNNARGQLVNEVDLVEALASGKVAAAGLDVVSTEPIKADNPLLKAPNCIITPHISWAPKESRRRIMDCTVENIRAFLNGKPVHVVNMK